MNPSSLRISATRTLSLDEGMSTFSCSARLPLRMRVSRSAMGSLLIGASSPARLHDARHLTLERQLAEAETAQLELAQVAPGPAAQLAATVTAGGKLRRPLGLHDERDLGHTRATP